MRIRLLMVGRTDRGYVADGLEHYLERLAHLTPVDVVIVPPAGAGGPEHQRRVEGERLLAAVEKHERVVVLDERGRALGSEAFAGRLGAWRDQGVRQAAFLIGGAYGHDEPVRDQADLLLSLSPMTFPHQLVRVVLAEQLYRAFNILKGGAYHH
jgi:23S rRNA (pseudouridine1915-N3)-methyltransferase